MRIVIATEELGYRGTPRVVENYARILASEHDVLVWAWKEGGEIAQELVRAGFRVMLGADCIDEVLSFHPAIVNFHRVGMPDEFETKIIRRFRGAGARCVETNVFGRFDPTTAGLFDVSFQISRWNLFQWNAWRGTAEGVGVYIPNPVDANSLCRTDAKRVADYREKLGIGQDGFVVGRIGNTAWKTLAEPMRQALAAHKNLHVIHVADHKRLLPEGLANHPRMHVVERLVGPMQLSEFYSACDVCVSMSPIGESFGLVNAESMLCGTPVIALSTPLHCNAQVEVVRHGEGGLVIAAPKDFPIAVDLLARHPEVLQHQRAVCRGLIASRYSLEVVGPDICKAFALVAKGASREDLIRAGLIVETSTCEVLDLLDGLLTRHGWCERVFIRLLYTPLAWRVRLSLSRMRRGR